MAFVDRRLAPSSAFRLMFVYSFCACRHNSIIFSTDAVFMHCINLASDQFFPSCVLGCLCSGGGQ